MFDRCDVDPLSDLELVVERLVTSPGVSGPSGEGIQRLSRAISQQQAVLSTWVREMDTSRAFEADDALTMASWLRNRVGVSRLLSFGLVKRARMLERLPGLAAAFLAGTVSGEHVDAVGRAWTPAREAALADLDVELTGFCKIATPDEVRDLLRGLCEQLDGDDGAGDDATLDARQYLYATVLANGMVKLDGMVAADIGETALSVLDAIMDADRDAPGDRGRERPRRRADALGIVFQLVSNHAEQLLGDAPMSVTGRQRPVMRTIVDLALFRNNGTLSVEHLAAIRAEAEHVGRLSRSTLERIACDCSISTILIDGTSEPLNVGRQRRNPTAAQWAALVTRDGGCTHPGCTAPVSWCEAHHVWFWERGGPTNLTNLRLLCWKHHRLLHQREAITRRQPHAA